MRGTSKRIFLKKRGWSAPNGTGLLNKGLILNLNTMFTFFINNYLIIFLAGMGGAFIADILKDNCIELPKKIGGRFFLGSFGGFIVGGLAGITIDGSLLTAFMAGFTGKEIIIRLINNPPLIQNKKILQNETKNLDCSDETIKKTAP